MTKLDILLVQLNKHIVFFDDESKKHKKLYRSIKYAIFTLTAISTILASLAAASMGGPYMNILVVVVSAAIGLLTSIEGMRKPAELWMHERALHHAFEDLHREIEFHRQGNLSDADIDTFFARIQGLLSTSASEWRQQIHQGHKDSPKNISTDEKGSPENTNNN
jgi:hypothetical protein